MNTDLDALLEALDAADTAVREIYRRLAEDPDRADEYEAGLRELRAKRAELARQAGMAALVQRRVSPSAMATTTEPPPPAVVAPATNGSASSAAAMPAGPVSPASEPAPTAAASSPASPPLIEAPASVQVPSPPSSAPVPPAPASDAQLAAFKAAVVAKGLGAPVLVSPAATSSPAGQKPWPVTLHELMCLLGPRETDLDDAVALQDELDALDEVATPERQAFWVRFPIEVQKHWLSHLVARTRTMRDHPSSEGVLARLKTIRAVYPAWARDYVPGHINGLQLKHTPIREMWASDADEHWRALVAVVEHEVPTARKNPPTRKKKERAVEDEPVLVEADWPLLPVTRGKTALIVGGAPKEPNRDRLEAYLRLATLEWPLVDGPRKVEAVAQRIAKGAYDLVIVVQTLIGHPEAERILDAAKASRTRWAMVDGYGAAAVRQGIERFVKPASKVG